MGIVHQYSQYFHDAGIMFLLYYLAITCNKIIYIINNLHLIILVKFVHVGVFIFPLCVIFNCVLLMKIFLLFAKFKL